MKTRRWSGCSCAPADHRTLLIAVKPLYLSDFGFVRDPFSVTPDPSFLYLSASHREALAQLEYGIKARKGFVLLTGEVGTGKTTLIHALLEELNGSTKTALVFNTVVNSKDLLRYICEDFGIIPYQEDHREVHDYLTQLNRFLLESYRRGDNVALVIDEAQNLTTEVLESIRLLSNFETSRDKLLQILLVGQPELKAKIDLPHIRQLKQRIGVRCTIRPLSPEEVSDYIRFRLRIAGAADLKIFTEQAVREIARYTGGIPRLVNLVCDHCLLVAYADRRRKIGLDAVEQAIDYLEEEKRPSSARRWLPVGSWTQPLRWLFGVVAVAIVTGALYFTYGPTVLGDVSIFLESYLMTLVGLAHAAL